MKKIGLLLSMIAVASVGVQAETITTTYYGQKANDSMKNPCRGDCVTICATITKTIPDPAPGPVVGGGVMTTVVRDGDGNEIGRTNEFCTQDFQKIVDEIYKNLPSNAEVVISDNEDVY